MCKSEVILNSSYLCSKSYDFLAVFSLVHSKINQIAKFLDDNVTNHLYF